MNKNVGGSPVKPSVRHYSMRQLLTTILTFILITSSARTMPLRQWGFKAGYTGATQVWEVVWFPEWINTENTTWRSGFHFGIYTEWFDYRNFSLVAGLNFEQKGMDYKFIGITGDPETLTSLYHYISVPVLVKYSVETRYLNPYVLAGPRMDISVPDNQYVHDDDPWRVKPRFRNPLFGLSVGAGVERPLSGSRNILVEFVYNYDPSWMCDVDYAGPGNEIRVKIESFNITVGIGFSL